MSGTAAPKRKYRMVARAEAAAATGERVLDAAWRHFSGSPYETVRLADIAADAGVTVQTLHSRFGTKDELFVAAWRWMAAQEGARREGAPAGDVREAVRRLYDSYEARGDANLRLMTQEDRLPGVKRMVDSGRAWQREWVARTFAAQLRGTRGAARERRLAALVVACDLLTWKLLRRDMGLDRVTAERIVTEMVQATKGAP
jgi:AcrR family transcriptional regulator